MLKVTFTGTREGINPFQKTELKKLLSHYKDNDASIFIHGDCIGADAEAHTIAQELEYEIWIYPGNIRDKRANCTGATITLPEWPTLARNKRMVANCDIVIACPRTNREINRSGTWATIRYANRMGKQLNIIYPS